MSWKPGVPRWSWMALEASRPKREKSCSFQPIYADIPHIPPQKHMLRCSLKSSRRDDSNEHQQHVFSQRNATAMVRISDKLKQFRVTRFANQGSINFRGHSTRVTDRSWPVADLAFAQNEITLDNKVDFWKWCHPFQFMFFEVLGW